MQNDAKNAFVARACLVEVVVTNKSNRRIFADVSVYILPHYHTALLKEGIMFYINLTRILGSM